MFSKNNAPKRKNNEYHDPDYANDDGPSSPRRQCLDDQESSISPNLNVIHNDSEEISQRLRQIIEKQLNQEIERKKCDLEQINERLEKTWQQFDNLRHVIIEDFYKKQEIPLNPSETEIIKDETNLFDVKSEAPQFPLHPSLKKIIGKKPKNLDEIFCLQPRRAAANVATVSMRSESREQKRHERNIQKMIRQKGIVIDHSKQNTENAIKTNTPVLDTQNSLKNNINVEVDLQPETVTDDMQSAQGMQSLNRNTLNNKKSLLIAVGNTSQYVGHDNDDKDVNRSIQITHKWILYLLPKDKNVNLNKFIKRVRFILHPSYAPNQVVDITSAPFQICRRGWGEFPVRIQILFHEYFQQNPLQFVHKLILDKTFSGLHVMGSETIVQIWLRSTKEEEDNKNTSLISRKDSEKHTQTQKIKSESYAKPVTAKMNVENQKDIVSNAQNNKELDENLFDFLNKINGIPSPTFDDINQIKPTILPTEPLKSTLISPKECKNNLVQSEKRITNNSIAKIAATTTTTTANIITNNSIAKIAATTTTTTTTANIITNNSIAKIAATTTTATTSLTTLSSNPQTHCKTEKTSNNSTIPLISLVSTKFPKLDSTSIGGTTKKSVFYIENKGSKLNAETNPTSETKANICPTIKNELKQIPTTTDSRCPAIKNELKLISTTLATAPKVIYAPAISKLSCNKQNPPSSNNNTNSNSNNNPLNINVSKSVANSNNKTTPLPTDKTMLQRKLVKVVYSTGNVKYMPMYVAATNTNARPAISPNKIISSKEINTSTTLDKEIATKNNVSFVNANATSDNTKPALNKIVNVPTTKAIPVTLLPKADGMKNDTLTQGRVAQMNKPTKNVFQIAGKVYMIDPLHSKIKQQKNKQESLLKPQVSLLKLQEQKHQQNSTQIKIPNTNYHNVANDHDYVPSPLPNKLTNNSTNKLQQLVEISKDSKQSYKPIEILLSKQELKQPPLHLSIREARSKAAIILHHQEQARIRFEQQFQCYDFSTIRGAIEFLLRRVPLVALKELTHNDMLLSLGFVKKSLREFQRLPAFKQRSCEWLRAKYVQHCLHSHNKLLKLHESGQDVFWTTREILVFARFYMYTPIIKSLDTTKTNCTLAAQKKLSLDKSVDSKIVTPKTDIMNWLDSVWPKVQAHEVQKCDSQILDVEELDVENVYELKPRSEDRRRADAQSKEHERSKLNMAWLQPPMELANEIDVMKHISMERNLKDLEPEEIISGVMTPKAEIVLAKALNLFIGKILRETVSQKLQQQINHRTHTRANELKMNTNIHQSQQTCNTIVTDNDFKNICISPEDISNVIVKTDEFDFLSNKYFGSNLP